MIRNVAAKARGCAGGILWRLLIWGAGFAGHQQLACCGITEAPLDMFYVTHEYTTPAYSNAAVNLLLDEANSAARALALPEKLPITVADLAETYVPPGYPFTRSFGNITTRSYGYFSTYGNQLNSVTRLPDPGDELRFYPHWVRDRYLAPIAGLRASSNNAVSLAVEWLKAFNADVPALLHDAKISVMTPVNTANFVPFHVVLFGDLAEVHLIEPSRTLLDLVVKRPAYNHRKTLSLPNREDLLAQTDDPKMRQMWFITPEYKKAAVERMIREVNAVSRELRLGLRQPVTQADLTEVLVETPYLANHGGVFAAVTAGPYQFVAYPGNKLGAIERRFDCQAGEEDYRVRAKSRYLWSSTRVDTNAAYHLAATWLTSLGVRLASMQKAYPLEVTWWDVDGQFVPIYKVQWLKRRGDGRKDVAATVELLLPERQLKGLIVERAEYLDRTPLRVPGNP